LELVKLSKELRKTFLPIAIPGSVVRLSGERKVKLKTGEVQLKAYSLILVSKNGATADSNVVVEGDFGKEKAEGDVEKSAPFQKKAKILVCQKSSCHKRGAGGVCKALEAALSDRGLEEQVTIQKTGCLKQCKAGPNIVMLPNKERYSKIDPQEIPELIEKHFAS
jgi:(2Fe-2S) ferredoxin